MQPLYLPFDRCFFCNRKCHRSKTLHFAFVIQPVFPMFDKISVLYAGMRMHEADCQGHLEFRLFFGNAGTGTCQRGATEHGCEFAPVAAKYRLYIEILRVPCRHNVGIRSRRTVGSIRSKQPERQNGRKQKCLKEAGVFCLKENLMDKSRKQNYNTLKIFFASKIEKKENNMRGQKIRAKLQALLLAACMLSLIHI